MYVKLCVQIWKVIANKCIYFFYPQCNLWFSTQFISFRFVEYKQNLCKGLASESGTASSETSFFVSALCSVQMLKE